MQQAWKRGEALDLFRKYFINRCCHLFVRQVFDMDGNFRFRFGSPGSRDGHFQFPSGVAVTSEGNIVVADSMNNRIQVGLVLKVYPMRS